MRRYMPLAAVATVMVLVWLMGWHKQLTLENIAANRDVLHHTIVQHRSLEHFPLDVNRNGHRGFPRTRKSDSSSPSAMAGVRWRGDIRTIFGRG